MQCQDLRVTNLTILKKDMDKMPCFSLVRKIEVRQKKGANNLDFLLNTLSYFWHGYFSASVVRCRGARDSGECDGRKFGLDDQQQVGVTREHHSFLELF